MFFTLGIPANDMASAFYTETTHDPHFPLIRSDERLALETLASVWSPEGGQLPYQISS